MINVTKTFLPPFEEYTALLKRAWGKGWITNNGELVQELEQELKDYLGVKNLLFASNGTIVLQMALKVLNITKEVITTPFSYVATTNCILWEGCQPVFVDIDPTTYCIDADKIEAAITDNTQAIMATHVYGIPCDVERIAAIASKYNLKVIYDGAHAFGCSYKGKSLLSYGDISTCSFHATKLFHTVEGGCIIANDDATNHQLMLYRQFGHVYDDYFSMGVNGKNSEFHAAMGLCILPKVGDIIENRKEAWLQYNEVLSVLTKTLFIQPELSYNYAYYSILLRTESQLLYVFDMLKQNDINARRYFYPSLNELPFIKKSQSCPISEDISRRVLCLPLYYGIDDRNLTLITECIVKCITC
ncbi:MAG: DegT/DnrJ/EryC1/StrS family aminotransferase [Ferruginibacter sp.]